MRVLNVAEKPSVAKTISRVLSRGQSRSRAGPSRYNHVHEFGMDLQGRRVDMVFTSVTGHLMELDFGPEMKKWNSCRPIDLFDAPVYKRVPQDKKDIERGLINEARRCEWLVLWLDCDREGENIAFEVLEVCRNANPRLRVLRAQFSSLVPRELHHACQNLREPNERFSIAVDTRQEIDLRLGAAFTRWQTMHLRRTFEDIESVVSYGPCQFPTLGFVVERYLRRERFEPENFWRIEVTHRPAAGEAERKGAAGGRSDRKPAPSPMAKFEWERTRLFCLPTSIVLYEECTKAPIATVRSVRGTETRKQRPLPLATVEFQKRASRYLRMDSKHAMEIAEKLYQRGILSYPRTETNKFKSGFDLRALVEAQSASPQFGAYARGLVEGGFAEPRAGPDDDGAHPPIHPKIFDASLAGEEKRVFDLVARHFLACCSRDAIGHRTVTTIEIGPYERFTASGLAISQRNWLDVYPFERWSDRSIPVYREGETFMPTTLLLKEGRTEPPPLLREADLIQLMNANGIGTDATIAEHIAKVRDRGYVMVNNQTFQPSELGIALHKGYERVDVAMSSPHLRQQMERDIALIAAGQKTKQEVLNDCLTSMRGVYTTVTQNSAQMDAEMAEHFPRLGRGRAGRTVRRTFSRCRCGAEMALRKSGEKRFLACSACDGKDGAPAGALQLPRGNLEPHDHTCPICGYQALRVTNSETKRTHHLCPYCFNHPPQRDVEDVGAAGDFRCFQCSEPSCALATKTSSTPVAPCPTCAGGSLTLRKNNNYYLACSSRACRTGVGFSKAITAVDVTSVPCPQCSARGGGRPAVQLRLTCKQGQVPPHLFPTFQGCALCSVENGVLEGVAYRLSGRSGAQARSRQRPRQPPARQQYQRQHQQQQQYRKRRAPAEISLDPGPRRYSRLDLNSGGDRAPPPYRQGGAQPFGGGGRADMKCFNCGQPGHFASNCPQGDRGGGRGRGGSRRGSGGGGAGSNCCFTCGEPGHFSNDCPQKRGGFGGGQQAGQRQWRRNFSGGRGGRSGARWG